VGAVELQSKQKLQSVRDEGMLGTETVRRRPGEPTSKLAADSTLSPKVKSFVYVVVYMAILGHVAIACTQFSEETSYKNYI